jgi:hypothetical protein
MSNVKWRRRDNIDTSSGKDPSQFVIQALLQLASAADANANASQLLSRVIEDVAEKIECFVVGKIDKYWFSMCLVCCQIQLRDERSPK